MLDHADRNHHNSINMSNIKVGDYVMWRGAWGTEVPKKAKVIGLELTRSPKDKEGVIVEQVKAGDHFLVDLDNGKWAYGWQIKPIE